MRFARRLAWAAGSFATLVFILWFVPQVLDPTPPTPEEKLRDRRWVDSSPYWLDRQTCRWLSLCGVHHLRWDAPALPDHENRDHDGDDGNDGDELRRLELRAPRERNTSAPAVLWRESLGQESWEIAGGGQSQSPSQERQRRDEASSSAAPAAPVPVPQYVLDYAPLVHLFSGENFWPSRIDEHIRHMVPYFDGAPLDTANNTAAGGGRPDPLTLDNLGALHGGDNAWVYLTSADDVEARPEWLHSHAGIPRPFPADDDDDDDDGDDGDDDDDTVRGPRQDAKNGHDYEQPPHRFTDDTTWFEVDDAHPLHRIADPRKLAQMRGARGAGVQRGGGGGARRQQGPADARVQQQARRQAQQQQQQQQQQAAVVVQAPGAYGLPPAPPTGHKPDAAGYSRAPAMLVMVDKGAGIVDAFWFFFYSYNLGQTVLRVRYGNHVGDWEHCMIRFENGVPRALFLSEHAGGQAYAWSALEKKGGRPVIYSAVGSHAMYALPGTHPYVLPFKMLRDETDRGPLWDPARHHWAYHYDVAAAQNLSVAGALTPAAANPAAPTSWFDFAGPWGDELLPLGDPRQWRLFGQYHYITGPAGPKFKNLARAKVCQTDHCRLLYSLDAGKKASWYS